MLQFLKNKLRPFKIWLFRGLGLSKSQLSLELKSEDEDFVKLSYSQCGEDLLAAFVCTQVLRVENPIYLEIGSHSAKRLNNTYLFYSQGGKGVCVEPNPELYKKFSEARPRDICLNIGIALQESQNLDFYVMHPSTLSTFNKEEAERMSSLGDHKIEKIIQVPVLPVNKVLEAHFNERAPHFVSLDTEGLDYDILKSWDFSRWRPEIFCIETITYSRTLDGKKINSIFEFMLANDYFSFADTYVNTIFVDNRTWGRLKAEFTK